MNDHRTHAGWDGACGCGCSVPGMDKVNGLLDHGYIVSLVPVTNEFDERHVEMVGLPAFPEHDEVALSPSMVLRGAYQARMTYLLAEKYIHKAGE